MNELLAPRQLGYEVQNGAKVAVHAARLFLWKMGSSEVVLKLDFNSAFNSVQRDRMF